jgi:hypothetical protein
MDEISCGNLARRLLLMRSFALNALQKWPYERSVVLCLSSCLRVREEHVCGDGKTRGDRADDIFLLLSTVLESTCTDDEKNTRGRRADDVFSVVHILWR